MKGFENNISGYVKNLVQIRENNGAIFIVKDESEISILLNTKEFIENYFENIFNDIGIFQNLTENKLIEKVKTYVEPTLTYNNSVVTRTELIKNLDNDVLLIGNSGSGKSLFINKLISECLEGKLDYFPIFIRLSNYENLSEKLINLVFLNLTHETTNGENLFKAIYQEKNIIICLDGLDEIQSNEIKNKLSSEIFLFKKQFPKTKFLVTSRYIHKENLRIQFNEVIIADFNENQIDEFINLHIQLNNFDDETRLLLNDIKDNLAFTKDTFDFEENKNFWAAKSVQKASDLNILTTYKRGTLILTNPLTLSLIIKIVTKERQLPGSIYEVYSEYCNLNLNEWNIERKQEAANQNDINLPSFEWINLCNWIAYSFYEKEIISTSLENLYLIIKSYFEHKNYPSSNYEKVIEILSYDFGFIKHHNGNYSFFHRSVLEYFYAQYLIKNETNNQLILELFFHKKNKDVVFLYYEGLSIDKKKLFLNTISDLAKSYIIDDYEIIQLFKNLEQKLDENLEQKNKVFLLFFLLSVHLSKDVSSATTHINLSILEQLLEQFYDINIYQSGDYIYTVVLHRSYFIAKKINNDLAIRVSKELKEKYPKGIIENDELEIILSIESVKKLCSYLYIIERLLFFNKEKIEVNYFSFLTDSQSNTDEKNLIDLDIDFFDHNEKLRYALLIDDFEISSQLINETFDEVEIHPDVYINASTFYESLGIAGKCTALDLLEGAIYDIKNNSVYDNYKIDWVVAKNKNEFISILYQLTGSICVDIMNIAFNLEENDDFFLKCYLAFSSIPKEELTYPNSSWFAYVLKTMALRESDNNISYNIPKEYDLDTIEKLQYSLILYLKSIAKDDYYMAGFLNSIEICYYLEEFQRGKGLLLAARENIKNVDYSNEEKEIYLKKIEEFELIFKDK
ncbi:NACHT domain-containing protein [uncultured Tenacibaculum sp.]|uniref:NACHT domain-containing protein n=1 Tax=uncultured Tenacibaculum sp. TaxID=174713 RepID=UPI0026276C58|nr:NACHT domain-containing protein [uncultured Tenacibaculum sp.]